ncbi:MAG TPA: OpgC domain-containing protein [Acetobacteraceae bacterium]|nr:OpgC domain-containing protein [Acetobacteraceae bacterium]
MPAPSTQRDLRLDFFRGVALILIFIDHIPENVLSLFTLQSICFFDAAEVFIFISGFTAALVYGRRMVSKGALYAGAQVWRRAWQLYVAHIFLFVLFVAEVSYTAAKVKNPMYTEEMRVADFLEEPHIAVIKALTLQFQPVFLDILPMYILMLAIFPAVLLGLRRNWLLVVVPSLLVYAAVHLFDISVPAYPAGHVWFFNPLAWQLLFVAGAVLAYLRDAGHDFGRLLRILYPIAAVLFLGSVIVRVSWTLHTFWEAVPPLLLKELWPADKTDLSPVRLVPFFALVVLVAVRIPPTARFLSSAVLRPLVICGQQSLEIFCIGILLSALGHFVIGEYSARIPIQLAVNAAGIVIMIGTARIIDWYKRMDRLPVLQPAIARSRGEGSAE